jgi:hypothetical protein
VARTPVKGPLIIPNCAEVKIVWQQNGVTLHNVFHSNLVPTGPINPTVAESIFSGIKAQTATTAWLAHVDPDCSLSGVEVKDLRAGNNAGILSSGPATTGTGTGRPLSQGTAMVITLKTAKSGPGFVGRAYLPGLDDSVLASARNFDETMLALGVAFVTGIQTVVTPLVGQLVVAQRALNADPTSQNPAMQQPRAADVVPVTQIAFADTRVDSQRRRSGR